jgi:hypothetical protein
MQCAIPEFSQARQEYQTQSVTVGEFRPFHLPFEDNELLAKNSVFCDQVFTAACGVRRGTRGKNGVSGFVNILMASLIRWKKDLHALTMAESTMNLHFGWLMLIKQHNQNGGKQHGLVK